MDERLALLEHLVELARAQLEAIKRLDTESVKKLSIERQDAIFSLTVALQAEQPADVDEATRVMIRDAGHELKRLERRLATVSSTVVNTMRVVMPPSTAVTYGRGGALRR